MDAETRQLIGDLTTELERCEGMITRLYVLLRRADLADGFVTDAVHEQKQAIFALVDKVRGDGTHRSIVSIEGL